MHYDLIVVGAGTGGSCAAKTAAKQGYNVCLIDQKPKKEIGNKVCGDAVGKHHFDDLGVSPPKGDELAGIIKGADLFSPDLETVFRIKGEGFMINRIEFGQRLLKEALDCGVDLIDNTRVLKPIIKKDYVQGIYVKNKMHGNSVEYYGNAVIDASGMDAIIRNQIPAEWGLERKILDEDIVICYREIRKVQSIEDPEYIQMYFDLDLTPGGYSWIFPKGEETVNAGLGIQMKKEFLNPKEQFYNHFLDKSIFNNSIKIRVGGGILSTRRPINNMVGNGVLILGDAACQPNPIHGGGIGPSMLSGHLAGEVSCQAIEADNVSKNGLWSYNSKYMNLYGAKTAGLDVFRILLQKINNKDLNYGMKWLINEEDILKASMGEDLNLNITEKIRRVFRGIRRLSFLKALNLTTDKMREIKELFRSFTEPKEHTQWSARVESIINEMKNTTI